MITTIQMVMTDFTEHYPTGAEAYDGYEYVDGEYCETADDFKDFIKRLGDKVNVLTVLEVVFDARDIVFDPDVTEAIMEIVKDVTEWFMSEYK